MPFHNIIAVSNPPVRLVGTCKLMLQPADKACPPCVALIKNSPPEISKLRSPFGIIPIVGLLVTNIFPLLKISTYSISTVPVTGLPFLVKQLPLMLIFTPLVEVRVTTPAPAVIVNF